MTLRTIRPFAFISALISVVGCSSSPTTFDGGNADARTDARRLDMFDASPDVGVDARRECERDQEGYCRLITWEASAAFPYGVDQHVTVIRESASGDRLYVIGGLTNVEPEEGNPTTFELRREVKFAAIAADGSLGAWQAGPDLPIPLGFQAVATAGSRIYVLGGSTQNAPGAPALPNLTTYYSEFAADGALGPWRETAAIDVLRQKGTANVLNDRVYVIGGNSVGGATDGVISAPINADGSLGAFRQELPLLAPRTHHTSIVYDGALYVIGGLDRRSTLPMPGILRALPRRDGTFMTWIQVGEVRDPPWTHSTLLIDNHVWTLGGGHGDDIGVAFSGRVRRAPINPDGTMGFWEEISDVIPQARAHVHQTPMLRDKVYSVGGRRLSDLTSLNLVFVGSVRR